MIHNPRSYILNKRTVICILCLFWVLNYRLPSLESVTYLMKKKSPGLVVCLISVPCISTLFHWILFWWVKARSRTNVQMKSIKTWCQMEVAVLLPVVRIFRTSQDCLYGILSVWKIFQQSKCTMHIHPSWAEVLIIVWNILVLLVKDWFATFQTNKKLVKYGASPLRH